MPMSAFGVEDGRISKADDKRRRSGLAITSGGVAGTAGGLAAAHRSIPARVELNQQRRASTASATHFRDLADKAFTVTEQDRKLGHHAHAGVFGGAARRFAATAVGHEKDADQAAKKIKRLTRVARGKVVAGATVGAGVGALVSRRSKSN